MYKNERSKNDINKCKDIENLRVPISFYFFFKIFLKFFYFLSYNNTLLISETVFLFVWDWCISFTTSHFHQKLTYFTYTLSSMYTMTWASRLSWYKNNSYYKINMEKTLSWSKNRHWLINSNIDKFKRKTLLGNEKEFGWLILKIDVLALKINENREI